MNRQRDAAWLVLAGLMLWGLLHVAGGLSLLVVDAADALETLGPNAVADLPAQPGETTTGLLRFHSLNVLLGGAAVSGLALVWWRQRRVWQLSVALAVAVGLDVGLVAFLVVPGILPASQGLIGPALVLVATGGVAAGGHTVPVRATS